MPISTRMMAITTMSSIMVKPRLRSARRASELNLYWKKLFISPVRIFRAVNSRGGRQRENVKHVLATPTTGIRIVLHRALAPVGVSRHGVHGNAPEKAHVPDQVLALAILARLAKSTCRILSKTPAKSPESGCRHDGLPRSGCSGNPGTLLGDQIHALHQRFEVRRIALRAGFDANQIAVRRIFIAVNGVAHFTKFAPQFSFLLPFHGEARHRHRRRGQNQQDGDGDDQFEQGHPGLAESFANRRRDFPAHSSFPRGYCTLTLASLVTNCSGRCCESRAFTCKIEIVELPGATPLTTTPKIVPLPLTPGVLGMRVAETMAWPRSLSTRCTTAMGCCPPERNPP